MRLSSCTVGSDANRLTGYALDGAMKAGLDGAAEDDKLIPAVFADTVWTRARISWAPTVAWSLPDFAYLHQSTRNAVMEPSLANSNTIFDP